jgi:hypothetical protein
LFFVQGNAHGPHYRRLLYIHPVPADAHTKKRPSRDGLSGPAYLCLTGRPP